MTQLQGCTRRYMAPEIIPNGTKIAVEAYGEKIDVFSFAVLLWEMSSDKLATAVMPVPVSEIAGGRYNWPLLRQQIKDGGRPSLENVERRYDNGPAIAELIKRCWNPVPGSRPRFSQIKVHTPGLTSIVGRGAGANRRSAKMMTFY
jgi:serine/threonine protein kinase